MNELETQHVHEFRIRSSVLLLLIKGAIAWIALTVCTYAFDVLVVSLVGNGNKYSLGAVVLSAESLVTFVPLFDFILNTIYGVLVLYITLSWIYEYSMIKKSDILTHRGIVFSHEQVYEMGDIKTIEVVQGFWGKLFNTGTVKLYAHRAQKNVFLRTVSSPHAIAAHIRDLHPAPDVLEETTGK